MGGAFLIQHMKVLKGFYCTQEKKTYSVGDIYKGKRKDLGDRIEKPKTEKKNGKPKNLEDK